MSDKKSKPNSMQGVRRSIADQITTLRKERGLTIEHLGFQCSIKRSYLEKLELGKLEVSLGLLNVLADFFGKRIKIELVDLVEE